MLEYNLDTLINIAAKDNSVLYCALYEVKWGGSNLELSGYASTNKILYKVSFRLGDSRLDIESVCNDFLLLTIINDSMYDSTGLLAPPKILVSLVAPSLAMFRAAFSDALLNNERHKHRLGKVVLLKATEGPSTARETYLGKVF